MYYVFFIGPAGSGKSSIVSALYRWLNDNEIESGLVNLDPGVLNLPYTPDVDVRDYVNIEKVILDYNLGPNGALIACSDIIAGKIEDIKREIEDLNTDLILVDTPGQMELFAFRTSGPYVVNAFGRDRSMSMFLIDPAFSSRPSDFISIMLLSLSAQFRFNISHVNLLSKTDLITEEEVDKILNWVSNPQTLIEAIDEQAIGISREISLELFNLIERTGYFSDIIPVSINDWLSIENLYGVISRILIGGEDASLKQS